MKIHLVFVSVYSLTVLLDFLAFHPSSFTFERKTVVIRISFKQVLSSKICFFYDQTNLNKFQAKPETPLFCLSVIYVRTETALGVKVKLLWLCLSI